MKATTGSGKTTIYPALAARALPKRFGRICCTQVRRATTQGVCTGTKKMWGMINNNNNKNNKTNYNRMELVLVQEQKQEVWVYPTSRLESHLCTLSGNNDMMLCCKMIGSINPVGCLYVQPKDIGTNSKEDYTGIWTVASSAHKAGQ